MKVVWRLFLAAALPFTFAFAHSVRSNVARDEAPSQSFEIPIDHFGDYHGTYQNRYWLNDTYYQPGGPVVFFDVGAEPADYYLPWLREEDVYSYFMRVAKKVNGLVTLWEHRYYGESLPFAINENTTKEEWSFLTLDQALEDVVYFANRFTYASAESVHPSQTPWIWIGGSYPGARGTILRIRNSEIIYAAWASSAPTHTAISIASYWQTAERALPRNCSADWDAARRYADAALRDGNEEEVAQLKLRMQKASLSLPGNTTLADKLTLDDVKNLSIEEAGQITLQPISPDDGFFELQGIGPVLPFCEALETQNHTAEALKGGLISKHTSEFVFDAFLVAMSDAVTRNSSTEPQDWDASTWAGSWQVCNEMGEFAINDPNDDLSIISSFATESYLYEHACRIPFGDKLSGPPLIDNLNKYGDWFVDPIRVFFPNGARDPWMTFSVASSEPGSPMRVPDAKIPGCNETHGPSSYFGVTYPDRGHVPDRYTPLDVPDMAFYTSLGLFERALEEWLPCFEKT